MKVVYEGLICGVCAESHGLLWYDDFEPEGVNGKCMTCGTNDYVISIDNYVIPASVTIVKSKKVINLFQELELTKRLFEKQTELYKIACDEIEKLEAEVRMLRLGSKWGGQV
tara:strand:+ start:4467 stop:4802 length:336 start_codon:yes stop_codon:yes gene_type:complete